MKCQSQEQNKILKNDSESSSDDLETKTAKL